MNCAPIPITARHRLRLVAALRRVNKRFSAWDEPDAMALLPPTPRPWVEVLGLEREHLESLRLELVGALGEMDTVGLTRRAGSARVAPRPIGRRGGPDGPLTGRGP